MGNGATMKAENLNNAHATFEAFLKQLRAAHNDARDSGDGFAELLIFNLLHQSAEIGWQLAKAKEAAK